MAAMQPPQVLILTETIAVGRRWQEALAGAVDGAWLTPDDVPAGVDVEVVVTDLADADRVQSRVDEISRRLDAQAAVVKPVVLGVGAATWADLALPENCTPRELRLACELLGEVARLRARCERIDRRSQELRALAHTDPLTGLANRRAWDTQLAALCESSGVAPFCLAIVDLDRFKDVNDQRGMAAGDRAIERAARALARGLRRGDVVARLGGDEFGVLLPRLAESDAVNVLARLQNAVAAQTENDPVAPTASIGYAMAPGDGALAAELFAAAERGLRQAKRAGGNCICRG